MEIKHWFFVIFVLAAFYLEGQVSIPLETFYEPPRSAYNMLGEDRNYFKFSKNNQVEMGRYYAEAEADKRQKSGVYSLSNDNGIDFITIRWNNGENEKYLYLIADFGKESGAYLLLYKNDGEAYFEGFKSGNRSADYFSTMGFTIAASSYLTENKLSFSTEKLGTKIGECWVEGVPGNGIGEKLTLDITYYGLSSTMYISSGFVSYSKPNLYRENSRIKKIKITNQSGKSTVVELADTPHYQAVNLGKHFPDHGIGSKYSMEILEVYPGTKYTDTCVNSICFPGQVI